MFSVLGKIIEKITSPKLEEQVTTDIEQEVKLSAEDILDSEHQDLLEKWKKKTLTQ